ncbi:MAG: HD domain-containing protein [Candidatus Staskawiczbacteria bacterium]|nr:HD domain-containing protein [Candidatus Staskawiczbacteria bacterium]
MTIPKEVKSILSKLQKAGFEAYIVGGCVRDFLLERALPAGRQAKDWDVTTNAKPEEIQKVFPDPPKFSEEKIGRAGSFYKNDFFTVTILTGSKDPSLSEVEVTTYRSEAKYSDKRHPDEVKYAEKLEDDLSRRDFTVNAMALRLRSGQAKKEVIDLYDGQKDLDKKIIRTVGNPEERFNEDALRMLRAVRFATTLGFDIEEKTAEAIKKNSIWLEAISKERIRDEFVKIIMADKAADGIELLRELGLLKYILPELVENYGVAQNKHHIYDCYWHNVKSLEYAAKKKFNMYVRVASLLHDVGKAKSKVGAGNEATFYNHEMIGAKMVFQILNRLKFSNNEIEKITKLVRYHQFYYNVDEVKESSVRRLIKNVGPESIEELLQVRMADRIGSGVPKAEPYKLRHFKYLVDKVSKDPISVKMLKINGNDLMQTLSIKPGPKIGQILDALLGVVLDDPKKNTKEFLGKEAKKLGKLPDKELQALSEKSKEDKSEMQSQEDQVVKQKYWVK